MARNIYSYPIRNMANEKIDLFGLERELENFTMKDSSACYCREVFETAFWLNARNEKAKAETGSYLFIPRALVPISFEAQWQLQHAVDSYGCDYDWVYSEDGFEEILIAEGALTVPAWMKDDEEFEGYYDL